MTDPTTPADEADTGARLDCPPGQPPVEDRRGFLSQASTLAMAGGLVASYGTLGAYAGRFLYPAHPGLKRWLFVTLASSHDLGDSLQFRAPGGQQVTITRQAREGTAGDFIALSSICPHLGCQVRWEAQKLRFLCPCHNGVFDAGGAAVSGPPADAGQSLAQFPLKLVEDLLYIEINVTEELGP